MTTTENRPSADDRLDLLLIAAEAVITSGLGSWRMLQRKLRLNQADARTILDELGAAGVVGPDVGDPRDVLVPPDDVGATLARLRRDATHDTATPARDVGGVNLAKAPPRPPGQPATPGAPTAPPPGQPGTPGGGAPIQLAKIPPPAPGEPGARRGGEVAIRAGGEVATAAEAPGGGLAEPDPDTPTPDDPRPLLVAARRRGAHVVHTLRHDDHWTYATLRRTTRAVYITTQGGASWVDRAWGRVNHGHAQQQLRLATLARDPDKVEKWVGILDKLQNNRMARLQRLPKAITGVAVAVGVTLGVVAVALLVVGVLAAIAWGGEGWRWWWWLIGWTILIAAVLIVAGAGSGLVVALPLAARAMYREGRRVADVPRWMLSTVERRTLDAEITPHKVVIALRDAKIPALRKFIKEAPDGGAGMLGPITIVGRGIQVVAFLPSEVTTTDIKEKRERVAQNCDRHEHELLIGVPAPRQVELWFANPGALDEPIDPSPLLTMPKVKADLRTGRAPIGQTLKGDAVGLSLWQRHLLITGLSNQGKTKCLRAIALWAAFNPRVHFWIADLKGDTDWDMFRDRCDPGKFVKGPRDDDACAATLLVEAAVAEMERRFASSETEFDTIITIVDEAQKAYTNPLEDDDGNPFGGQSNKSRYCMAVRKLKNQGRAVNMLLWEGTQDPTNTNLPKITREATHIRIALVVGTESQSKMALGEAAVDGGAAPHELRPDLDRGTVVMHGGVDLPTGSTALTVRFHFIDDADAWKLMHRIQAKQAARAAEPLVIDAADTPDHLMAMYRAMRSEDTVRTAVILGRLIEDDEDRYIEWGHQHIARVVNDYAGQGIDIDIRKRQGGQSCLVLEDLERALRERHDDLP